MKLLMTAVCLVLLGLGAFFGLIRRSNRSLVRLATLLLSVAGAFFIARVAVGNAAAYALEYAKANWINDPEILSYIEQNPALVDALIAFARMLIAPIIFFVSYLALRTVSFVVYKLICFIFRVKGPRLLGLGRLAGAGVGLLCGFIGVLVLVVPVCGYSALASDIVDQLEIAEDHPVAAYTHTIASVGEAPVASLAFRVGGEKLFEGLTTVELGEGEAMLREEANAILALIDHAGVLSEVPIESYGTAQSEAVMLMADDVGNSFMVSHIGSGLLATVSNRWLANDSFLGIERPAMGENADIIVNAMLGVLSTSNADNIDDDLRSVAEVFGLMVECEIFPLLVDGGDPDALAAKLATHGVLEGLYEVLEHNPRMLPLKQAFAELGIRILMDELGLPDNLKDSHGELLSDVGDALVNAVDAENNINVDVLKTEVADVMEKHGIGLDDSAVKLVSESIAQEFTGEELKALSDAEIVDRLANYLHTAGTPAA